MSADIKLNANIEERFAVHVDDYRRYDTETLRRHFHVPNVFGVDEVRWVYTHYDRMMVGGVIPQKGSVELLPVSHNKMPFFLARRELGVINVGGAGTVSVDGALHKLDYKEALYVGKDSSEVIFSSADPQKPARFYLLSTPAHMAYPTVKVGPENGEVVQMGALETSNARTIRKLLVSPIIETCQLQMGMTELKAGSVWNTMPPHTHSRRMEVYFYFEVPENQAVCHFMGPQDQTRHIWLNNQEAVISPPWSMHCAAGTSNYIFIWGMAGENLDYGDMDFCRPCDLR
jgi:4-deoxy-L-threo-5-hexosulose-uronate ketol-isomerase